MTRVLVPPLLEVTAYGLPAPQGSKRHVGNGVMVESSKRVRPWREAVKHAALDALDLAPYWPRDARTLGLHLVFTLPRPRKHYRTGKSAHQLRADAPHLVSGKPDLDKLIRSTCDALGDAGVYADDCRIAQVYALKAYPLDPADPWPHPHGVLDRPGAHIAITGVLPDLETGRQP